MIKLKISGKNTTPWQKVMLPWRFERIFRFSVFYKKELISDRVTNALFMFVVRRWNAVQICLIAVILNLVITKQIQSKPGEAQHTEDSISSYQ